MKKLIIISPNHNSYSETFIQAHKKFLYADTDFLYDGSIPKKSEKNGSLSMFFQRNNKKFKIYKLLPVFIYERLFAEKLNPIFFLKYYLKRQKPHVVLAEYGVTGADITTLLKELQIPLIVHFHGYDASITELIEKYKAKYLLMFEYANAVIVVSELMKSKLINIGCSKDKITVTPCAPDDSFLEIKPKYEKKQFIAIGRFVDKKGPYLTILAFMKVVKIYPDTKLIVAGDGYLLNTCKNLVKYLKIGNSVYFPGVISPKQYMNYIEESLAFVQHSLTAENGDMEGTPVSVLEASAAGIPVISTKHAGISDVIIDEVTGLLIEEHDVEGMAKNMIRVIEDVEFAKKMGENGKQRILKNFTMENHIGKIQNMINGQ